MSFPTDGYGPWEILGYGSAYGPGLSDSGIHVEMSANVNSETVAHATKVRAAMVAALTALKSYLQTEYPSASISAQIRYLGNQSESL